MYWIETKTNKQKRMAFQESAIDFMTCPFHSWGACIIAGNTDDYLQPEEIDGGPAIFPRFVGRGDGAVANYITTLMKREEFQDIEGMPENPTSTDFRNGPLNFIANHPCKFYICEYSCCISITVNINLVLCI